MNSQNDYLKHSPHWIYADVCSWNTGRGQKEDKEFENCNIQNTLFTLSTLSNIYPILLQSGYFSSLILSFGPQAIIRLSGRLSHNGGEQPSINLLLMLWLLI